MNAWFGYRQRFMQKMLSLKLSNFEKTLWLALILTLAVNIADAIQWGYTGQDKPQVAQSEGNAAPEWMALEPEPLDK